MMLAPLPVLSGVRRPLSSGIRGVHETLREMRRLVCEGRADMAVRQAAVSLIWLQPEKDEFHEVDAIFEYVRDRIRYVRDIVNVETLSTPAKTLAQMIGDCDDQTTLLAAMLESVGYPTRFVVAGYSKPNEYEHVYLQVWANDTWINCDPTEREPIGFAPPGAVAMMIEQPAC